MKNNKKVGEKERKKDIAHSMKGNGNTQRILSENERWVRMDCNEYIALKASLTRQKILMALPGGGPLGGGGLNALLTRVGAILLEAPDAVNFSTLPLVPFSRGLLEGTMSLVLTSNGVAATSPLETAWLESGSCLADIAGKGTECTILS